MAIHALGLPPSCTSLKQSYRSEERRGPLAHVTYSPEVARSKQDYALYCENF